MDAALSCPQLRGRRQQRPQWRHFAMVTIVVIVGGALAAAQTERRPDPDRPRPHGPGDGGHPGGGGHPPPPPPLSDVRFNDHLPPRDIGDIDLGLWTDVLNSSFACPDTRFVLEDDTGTNVSACLDGYSQSALPISVGWMNSTQRAPTTITEILTSLNESPAIASTCRGQVQGQCTADCVVRCIGAQLRGSNTQLTCLPNGTLVGEIRLCLRLTKRPDLTELPLCQCQGPFPTASLFACERAGVTEDEQCQQLNYDGSCPSLGCFRHCRRDLRVSEIKFWAFTAPSIGLISAMSLPATKGPSRYLRILTGQVDRVLITSPEGCARELDPMQDWRLEDGRSAFAGRYNLSLDVYDSADPDGSPLQFGQIYTTNPQLRIAPTSPAFLVMNSTGVWPRVSATAPLPALRSSCGDLPTVNISHTELCRQAPYMPVCVNGTGTPPYTVQRNVQSLSDTTWPSGVILNTVTGLISIEDESILVPGTYNVSIVVFDGNQQTASTGLQIHVLAPLRVVVSDPLPWTAHRTLAVGREDRWNIVDAVLTDTNFFRGAQRLSNVALRGYTFVACAEDPNSTVRTEMGASGTLTYSGVGFVNLSVGLIDTRVGGTGDMKTIGNLELQVSLPSDSPPNNMGSPGMGSSASQARGSTVSDSTLITAIVIPILVIIAVLALWAVDRKNRRRALLAKKFGFPPSDAWEYDRARLVMGKELGAGAFGVVHIAVAPGIRGMKGSVCVAVKECSEDCATQEDMQNFVREADLMKRIDHPKVLRLLGVCMQDHPLLLITEVMQNGDLKEYLRAHRAVSVVRLMTMCEDVAEGLSYLATHHKFVHRDLACRNCLVGRDRSVVIADFGMTRANTYKDYYKMQDKAAMLPVRWMAPEALSTALFTASSDVWSLGVVCWEVTSFAEVPYPAMGNEEVFRKVRQGFRLPKPAMCPEPLYSLMLRCWNQDPAARPTANDVVTGIRNTKLNWRPESSAHNLPAPAAIAHRYSDVWEEDDECAHNSLLKTSYEVFERPNTHTPTAASTPFIDANSVVKGQTAPSTHAKQPAFYAMVPSGAVLGERSTFSNTEDATSEFHFVGQETDSAPHIIGTDGQGGTSMGVQAVPSAQADYSSISYGSEKDGVEVVGLPKDSGYTILDGLTSPPKVVPILSPESDGYSVVTYGTENDGGTHITAF